jgi:hypothetical protein
MTVAKYSLSPSVGISVMSPDHRTFGAGGLKSRRSRSGNFGRRAVLVSQSPATLALAARQALTALAVTDHEM